MANPTIARVLPAAAVLLAGAVALSGCSAGDPGVPSADLGHVHGLGVDPSTGETYAASHNGVWTVPTAQLPDTYPATEPDSSGAPRRIADRAQDTMGFVVARPGLLLGSGHPDPADPGLPGNLGLISSTDRANTWDSVSLSGEADFHDLDVVELPGQLRVYGYHGGIVKVSDDSGQTWTDRAGIEARDLAADPGNPDRLYATTEQGLMVSDDAGATFSRVDGAPPLYLVTVASDGTGVIGVDTEGIIWTSDGASWSKRGTTVGVPEALAFAGGDGVHWLLLADDRGVVATDDFGETVTVLLGKK
ncbi:hypothetical protein M3147_13380 [Agromyces mediolanus]|uniref:F510_1955 family glycosylhydrolase n=1 Tax=Agromyces mediolanus TaxID=41986 RepID=UPI00203D714F|nr:hypothetical protein [Agromyces mediolanus]MCM3658240.1 hypothetical protein [Agromyces mediolanus]